MIRPFGKDEDVGKLLPVIKEWLSECRANDFGIEIEETDYLDEVYKLIHMDDCDMLVMELEGDVIGIMGISADKSPLGDQLVANALYWYTLPEHRGKGINFIRSSRVWAKEKECTHLMLNASHMGSAMYEKVCNIYERLGLKKFETAYIEEIPD